MWRGAALPQSPPPPLCPSLWALGREGMDIAHGQLTCPGCVVLRGPACGRAATLGLKAWDSESMRPDQGRAWI